MDTEPDPPLIERAPEWADIDIRALVYRLQHNPDELADALVDYVRTQVEADREARARLQEENAELRADLQLARLEQRNADLDKIKGMADSLLTELRARAER